MVHSNVTWAAKGDVAPAQTRGQVRLDMAKNDFVGIEEGAQPEVPSSDCYSEHVSEVENHDESINLTTGDKPDDRRDCEGSKLTPTLTSDADVGSDIGEDDETVVPSISPLTSSHKDYLQFPQLEGEEGENAEATPLKRVHSPSAMPPTSGSPTIADSHDRFELHRMHKFSLYETQTRYFLVGSDVLDQHYRVLKIDRTAPPGQLSVTEDETVYSRREVNQLLNTIEHGNRTVGGMRPRGTSWGLLGFIRFTEAYYMLLIKKKHLVATIGGHYVFQVSDTDLIPLTTGSSSNFRGNRNPEENRFLSILGNLDLNRHFYFSYSYNVTRTLQHNIIKRREMLAQGVDSTSEPDFNDMFVWNQHLLAPALDTLKNPYDWCTPIIHGFVDQAAIDVFGRSVYITIIARRSRFFAGARFLKRGANDLGYVANDVETEQIAADMLVTSFNAPRLRQLKNPNYTSFVQHRGSIPLYWTQDSSGVSPKPAIDLNLIDPFYSTAALHFDNLFARYRAPVYVLNLIKARERTPRESKLLVEYQNAITYLNQSLPEGKKIGYRAYDMSRAAKTRGQNVIETLESIAEDLVRATGFFQNDGNPEGDGLNYVQNGVARSNCIDCLDRTNAAQYVIGKRALAWQLQALGVLPEGGNLNYDSDASNLFAHMFNDQGDTLASQYGGSHLVNTTDSYRKIANWQSHSRDMLESFKRYYHNSFLDSQRQEAYNLFLGNYIYVQGQPMLWELPTDYHLHHSDPRSKPTRRDYINWFTPEYLEPAFLPPVPEMALEQIQALRKDWWDEYYRPSVLTSYHKLFAWNMNSTLRYLPKPSQRPSNYDLSPFSVRKTTQEPESQSSRDALKGESMAVPTPLSATSPPVPSSKRIASFQKWLHPDSEDDESKNSPVRVNNAFDAARGSDGGSKGGPGHSRRRSMRSSTFDDGEEAKIIAGMKEFKPSNKQLMKQWTLAQFHANSLNPSVSEHEVKEYEQYVKRHETIGADYTSFPDPATISATNGENDSSATKRPPLERAPRSTQSRTSFTGKSSKATKPATLPQSDDTAPPVISPETIKLYEAYVRSGTQGEPASTYASGAQLAEELRLEEEMAAYLRIPQTLSLSVTPEDMGRKRYQAYYKYMQGKSFFKQNTVDPEVRLGNAVNVGNGVERAVAR